MEGGQKIAIEKKFTPDIFGKKKCKNIENLSKQSCEI